MRACRVALAFAIIAGAASFGLVAAPSAPSAGANQADDIADTVFDKCKELPVALAGTASGGVAFVTPFGPGGGTISGVGGAGTLAGGAVDLGGAAGASAGAGAGVGGGGLVMATASVAAAAVTAVGGFCGGVKLGKWLWGEGQADVSDLPGVNVAGPALEMRAGACSDFGISAYQGRAACSIRTPGVLSRDGVPEAYNRSGVSYSQATPTEGAALFGASAAPPGITVSGSNQTIVSTSGQSNTSVTVAAGAAYNPGTTFGSWHCTNAVAMSQGDKCLVRGNAMAGGYWMTGQPTVWVAQWPLDRDLFAHGYLRSTTITTTCWSSPDGNGYVTRTITGPVQRDDEPVELEPRKCVDGEILRSLLIQRTAPGGTPETVWWWNHPAKDTGIVTLPTPTRQCWVVGVTTCPMWDSNPADPNATVQVGGPGGTPVPKGAPTTTDVLIPGIETVWPPDPNPTPTTTAVPTTVPVPTSTVVTPTTTTPAQGCDAGAPGCPTPSEDPPPNDPGDGDGDSCWPDGWGWFNPVEWVYRPVKCVLTWLFVPPEPEWSNALDGLQAHSDEAPLQWATGAVNMVTNSSIETVRWRDADLPCMPSFCLSSLDGFDFPGWLKAATLVGLWTLIAYSVARFL